MTTQTTIQRLAAAAAGYFRYSGDTPSDNTRPNIYTLSDGAPDWVHELVYQAHGDMMPDDYRYRFIACALEALTECADVDDARDYNEPSIYNGELLSWLSSHLSRYSYVDQAVEDFGYPGDLMTAIMRGQLEEMYEVFDSVLSYLEQRAEEDDDEE